MIHYIYCITNVINNKKYIGQTVNIKRRFKNHVLYGTVSYNYKQKSFAIHSAIKKYGLENFQWEILAQCEDIDESNLKEEYFIKDLNTLTPNGYNLIPGGNNRKVSESTKEKLSANLKITSYFIGKKGEDHPNFGTKLSEERKQYLSNKFSGDNGSGKKINSSIARQIYCDYLNDKNHSASTLSKLYGLKKVAILNILNKRCWKEATANLPDANINDRVRGEKFKNSKITEEICINILKDYYWHHKSKKEIMESYNVTYGIVHNIIMRKNWKHIEFQIDAKENLLTI